MKIRKFNCYLVKVYIQYQEQISPKPENCLKAIPSSWFETETCMETNVFQLSDKASTHKSNAWCMTFHSDIVSVGKMHHPHCQCVNEMWWCVIVSGHSAQIGSHICPRVSVVYFSDLHCCCQYVKTFHIKISLLRFLFCTFRCTKRKHHKLLDTILAYSSVSLFLEPRDGLWILRKTERDEM